MLPDHLVLATGESSLSSSVEIAKIFAAVDGREIQPALPDGRPQVLLAKFGERFYQAAVLGPRQTVIHGYLVHSLPGKPPSLDRILSDNVEFITTTQGRTA